MKEFSLKENSLIARLAAGKLGGKRVAIVIGNRIHLHGVSKKNFLSNPRWLRHELKHVQQFEQHGFIPFIIKYLWHNLFHGYHNCCYEKEARDAEADESLISRYQLYDKDDELLDHFSALYNTNMQNETLAHGELYDAPVEKVWAALTEKEQMKQWYFDIPDFELKSGSVFNFYEPGGNNRFHHQCRITEIIPLKKFEHTWAYPAISKGETIVTWELIPKSDKTLVTLSHSGTESFADGGAALAKENFAAGWKEILGSSLKKYLEG